jgi:hypothetical protein
LIVTRARLSGGERGGNAPTYSDRFLPLWNQWKRCQHSSRGSSPFRSIVSNSGLKVIDCYVIVRVENRINSQKTCRERNLAQSLELLSKGVAVAI